VQSNPDVILCKNLKRIRLSSWKHSFILVTDGGRACKHVPPQHKTSGSLKGFQGGQEHLNMSIYTYCRIFQNACRAEKTWEENLWFFSVRVHFFFEKNAKVRFWCGSDVLIYWCYCCSCCRHLHAPLLHVKLVLHPIRSLEAPLNH
jgi:hypothetical protein